MEWNKYWRTASLIAIKLRFQEACSDDILLVINPDLNGSKKHAVEVAAPCSVAREVGLGMRKLEVLQAWRWWQCWLNLSGDHDVIILLINDDSFDRDTWFGAASSSSSSSWLSSSPSSLSLSSSSSSSTFSPREQSALAIKGRWQTSPRVASRQTYLTAIRCYIVSYQQQSNNCNHQQQFHDVESMLCFTLPSYTRCDHRNTDLTKSCNMPTRALEGIIVATSFTHVAIDILSLEQ